STKSLSPPARLKRPTRIRRNLPIQRGASLRLVSVLLLHTQDGKRDRGSARDARWHGLESEPRHCDSRHGAAHLFSCSTRLSRDSACPRATRITSENPAA